MYMDVQARFAHPATRFLEDPQLGPAATETTQQAMMGDIVQTADPEVALALDLIASAPIEKVELRNGLEVLETVRPYGPCGSGATPARHLVGRRIPRAWPGNHLGWPGDLCREYRTRCKPSIFTIWTKRCARQAPRP